MLKRILLSLLLVVCWGDKARAEDNIIEEVVEDTEPAKVESQAKPAQEKLDSVKQDKKAAESSAQGSASKIQEMEAEKKKITLELETLEKQKVTAEQKLAQSKAREKAMAEELSEFKQEIAGKIALAEGQIAALRVRFKESQNQIAAMEEERKRQEISLAKTQAQVQVAEQEVQAIQARAERGIANVQAPPAPATEVKTLPNLFTFKKSCRVFAGPTRKHPVLMVQDAGAQVSKVDEGAAWIAFKMPDGRQGFVNKNCLR